MSEDLISAFVTLSEGKVYELVKERLASGEEPKSIIEDLREGMDIIGDKYSKHEYFLSQLVMGSEILKLAMQQIEPSLRIDPLTTLGVVVIGTVRGDIHDLGKNIVITLLECAGFTVHDLGVDVPKEEFVEKVTYLNPDIVAMSGLMVFTRSAMKEVVASLEEAGFRDDVKIIIGGSFVDEEWRKDVGADAYGRDAYQGVEIAKKFVEVKQR